MPASRRDGGLAIAAAVAVIASFVVGKTARDAILLTTFDVSSLPLFIAIAAVLSIPAVLVMGRLMLRVGPGRLIPAINLASAALLVVEWLIRERHPEVSAVATFIHLSIFGSALVSGFWSIVNERFDPRSARQLVGRIGMAATLGGVLGGVMAERAAVYLAPGGILLVLAVLQVGCAAVLGGIGLPPRVEVKELEKSPLAAVGQVLRSSLLRTLAIVVVLDASAATAIDYVFKAEITASGPDSLLRYLAIYQIATNVVTAIVQIAFSARLIERLGVPRGIGSLPATVTMLGGAALLAPSLWTIGLLRGGEMVTRSSLYRAAYELLYAPLREEQKRSAKVALDVGAERLGDLLGAQLIASVLFFAPDPRVWLIGLALALAVVALFLSQRLPVAYTAELERSLRTRTERQEGGTHLAYGRQTLGEGGDLTAMSLLNLRTLAAAEQRSSTVLHAVKRDDAVVEQLAALRCGDRARVEVALAGPIAVELTAVVTGLLGWDAVALAASASLRKLAPQATGVLVDALLDAKQAFAVRRRLPAILEHGQPRLALWGLWQGLADERFEVRYRCGRSLARLKARGHGDHRAADVFAAVKRELELADRSRHSHRLLDKIVDDDDAPPQDRLLREVIEKRSASSLDLVFALLGLTLPPEPVRMALAALFTENAALRGTALEYLESVLPPDVKAALWPLLELGLTPAALAIAHPPREDPAARLRLSQEIIRTDLARQVAKARSDDEDR